MKKFFATFSSLILIILALSGCSSSTSTPKYNSAKEGEWMEIQSITYDGTTLTSSVSVKKTDQTAITKEEYDNAPNEQKDIPSILQNRYSNNDFCIDRQSDLLNLNNSINKTFYYKAPSSSYPYYTYGKFTVENYTIYYVKIRFVTDDSFELNYYENTSDEYTTTIRVKPTSYIITYFNN